MRLASVLLSAASAALLLAGCAVAPRVDEVNVLEKANASAVYSWEARGQMIFRCDYDQKGFFWVFLQPQGKLLDDKGRQQAVLGADFSVTARDGSQPPDTSGTT